MGFERGEKLVDRVNKQVEAFLADDVKLVVRFGSAISEARMKAATRAAGKACASSAPAAGA